MKTAKEVFTEIWIDNFGDTEQVAKGLTILTRDHGSIFEAMEEYGKQQYNQAIDDVQKPMLNTILDIVSDLKQISNNYIVIQQSYVVPKSVVDVYIEYLEDKINN